MLPENILAWGRSKSCIRELAAYGAARKQEIGPERVFDFSIGNPSVPAPDCVSEAMRELLCLSPAELHGYTPAPGLMSLREAVSADLKGRFGAEIPAELIYVCCGAAAGLASCLRGLLLPGEEVIAFAPFFPEYRVFTEGAGGVLVPVPPDGKLLPDFAAFERALTEKTKAVIVNTPNNPSGVVLPRESLQRLGDILRHAQRRFGHSIYLISDEPYRELLYEGAPLWVPDYYENTLVCYSFSKSLSLPGERIGYVAVSPKAHESGDVFSALAGAARACGYVNAPSFMQRVVEKCLGRTADISLYKASRDLLYGGLTELGFDCAYPGGAFYLFVRSLEPDAKAFSEKAKKHELLLVPSDDFGLGGYVRAAYCVPPEMIRRSLPAFRALAEDYGL